MRRSALFNLLKPLMFRVWSVQRGILLGVRIIATNEDGAVLLIRHGYTQGWHLPGGGVDHAESAGAAARRELLEETGFSCEENPSLISIHHNDGIWKGDHILLFRAGTICQVKERLPDFEIAEVGFFALDGLPEGTTRGTRARLDEVFNARPASATW